MAMQKWDEKSKGWILSVHLDGYQNKPRLKQRGPDTRIVTVKSSPGNQTTIISGICLNS